MLRTDGRLCHERILVRQSSVYDAPVSSKLLITADDAMLSS